MRHAIEEQCVGSVFRDVEYMAEYINIARTSRDVTVWPDGGTELDCSDIDVPRKSLPSPRICCIGADIVDTREGLIVLRRKGNRGAAIP